MVIVGVSLEVLVENVDALGQNGDLHLGRAGIGLMYAVFFDDLGFLVFQKHFFLFLSSYISRGAG